MYFHLAVHKVSKINVYISKSSIHLPWLQLESPGFARFLGSVTGPRLLLVALCPTPAWTKTDTTHCVVDLVGSI